MQARRFTRPRRLGASRRGPIACVEALEPRKLLSATLTDIANALDLPDGVTVSFDGHNDAIGVYENETVHGVLGLPTGPDGDFLVLSTAHAHDAVRTTDAASRDDTTRGRDLGAEGVADDYASITFTIDVPAALYNQRFLIDFLYASDEDTDGGDFFDIYINGVNIAETHGGRIEAGGQYLTQERDPDLDEDVPGYGAEIGTEYTPVMTASYTVPDGVTSLEVTIELRDSRDAEKDAWALVDNVRFEGTQVVYLDFDGESVADFFLLDTVYDVPDFDANDFGLGADYADVIRADLEAIFADFDLVFTTDVPGEGEYMHVVIGGDNSDTISIADTEANAWLTREIGDDPSFEEFFNYVHLRNKNGSEASYGQSDRLDLGNEVKDDMAVVFAEQINTDGYGYSHLLNTIAHHIGRNLGLRAEGNANDGSIMAEDIDSRGGAIENADHNLFGDKWGDKASHGSVQNAHQVLLDNLGAAGGEIALRNAWTDARDLNQAHWTIAPPTKGALHDAHFVILGDKHTRAVVTVVEEWDSDQVLVTDYAGQDPQIVITAASREGGRHTYETMGTRNLGQFTAVTDDATMSVVGLWEVTDRGAFFQGPTTLIQTQAAADDVHYVDFTFTEDDGDEVTIKLKSSTGLFSVTESDFGHLITLAETDDNKDSLTISVKKKGDGDGRAVIAGIQGTGVKKIKADKADFDGTGVDLTHLGDGKFGAFIDGTDFNVRMNEKGSAKYRFTEIDGDSRMVFGRQTKKLQADNIEGAAFVFDELKKLDSKANLSLTSLDAQQASGAKISAKENIVGGDWSIWGDAKESIKTLDVKGSATGMTIDAAGKIHQIKVKGDFDADVIATMSQTIKIDGNWSGSMQLADDDEGKGNSVNSIKVKGIAQNLLFQADDSVKTIKLGAAHHANFYVGLDFSVIDGVPVDGSLIENDRASVNKVQLTGVRDVEFDMIDSVFSAVEFKNLSLGSVNGQNLGEAFGVSATAIKKIDYDTGTGKVSKKNEESFVDNDSSDDFFIGRIV